MPWLYCVIVINIPTRAHPARMYNVLNRSRPFQTFLKKFFTGTRSSIRLKFFFPRLLWFFFFVFLQSTRVIGGTLFHRRLNGAHTSNITTINYLYVRWVRLQIGTRISTIYSDGINSWVFIVYRSLICVNRIHRVGRFFFILWTYTTDEHNYSWSTINAL